MSEKNNHRRKSRFFSLIFCSFVFLFFISFASAQYGYNLVSSEGTGEGNLGYYYPHACVPLIQTCSNCTYNNISSIFISNSGTTPQIISYSPNLAMSTADSSTYSYSFCNTTSLGTYNVNGYGNDGGIPGSWVYQFEVGLPLWVIIVVMIFAYGTAILGFFKYRNEWVSMAGGMVMLILGIYLTQYGLGIYNNPLTLAVAYITIALGGIALLVPIGEKLEVDMNFFDNR